MILLRVVTDKGIWRRWAYIACCPQAGCPRHVMIEAVTLNDPALSEEGILDSPPLLTELGQGQCQDDPLSGTHCNSPLNS